MDRDASASRDAVRKSDPGNRSPNAAGTTGHASAQPSGSGSAMAAAGETSQPNTAGAEADPGRSLGDWPAIVFRPNATIVNAGFFTWEIDSGEIICEPGHLRAARPAR